MITYNDLNIKTIVNGAGTYTKFGGSLIRKEVIESMNQASKGFVDIEELLIKSGEYIAKKLDVEDALVTCGAATGLALSTAACIAGDNKKKIQSLPFIKSDEKEIIILKSHRNPYDQAIKTAGGKIVEIGNSIETFGWQLNKAISEKTAAVFYFLQSEMFRSSLSLEEVIKIAHKNNVPVIVDAAAELPPVENLTKIFNKGADIVIFSGGKDIRGPQSSGLIVGKKDLVQKCRLNGYPYHSLGRPMKLDKETIMGFVTALDLYLKENHKKRFKKWNEQVDFLYDKLNKINGIKVKKGFPSQPLTQPANIPRLFIEIDKEIIGIGKETISERLMNLDPPIILIYDRDNLLINPHMLKENEEQYIANELIKILNR